MNSDEHIRKNTAFVYIPIEVFLVEYNKGRKLIKKVEKNIFFYKNSFFYSSSILDRTFSPLHYIYFFNSIKHLNHLSHDYLFLHLSHSPFVFFFYFVFQFWIFISFHALL